MPVFVAAAAEGRPWLVRPDVICEVSKYDRVWRLESEFQDLSENSACVRKKVLLVWSVGLCWMLVLEICLSGCNHYDSGRDR